MSTMTLYWIIFIAIALASWLVSYSLKSKFERYSQPCYQDCQLIQGRLLRHKRGSRSSCSARMRTCCTTRDGLCASEVALGVSAGSVFCQQLDDLDTTRRHAAD